MIFSMIMAMDKNRLIGAKGGMPWHLPKELQYFKRVTMGKPLIMGRKTFDSIGKPLPGRTSIVVTTQKDWKAAGVIVTNSLASAIEAANEHLDDSNEAMLIGGASLCQQAMSDVQRLYLTIIDSEFDGDVWLDSFNSDDWIETSCRITNATNGDSYSYRSMVLERNIGDGQIN